MRIPFPERIPIWYATVFAVGLAAFQVLLGTNALFSSMCIVFVVTATYAFNLAGGLTSTSGSYVFFFSVLAVIIGLVIKCLVLEAADSNLRVPMITIEAYTGGIIGMLGAVFMSRRFVRKVGFLENLATIENMRLAAVGCLIAGIGIPLLGGLLYTEGGNVFTPLFLAYNQINHFLPMAIILGVTAEVTESGGTRSINLPVLIAAGWMFLQGAVLNFSKEGLFLPPICWLATGAALRYRFTRNQIFTGLLLMALFGRYMVPFCQYGRSFRSETHSFSENLQLSFSLLFRLEEVRQLYAENLAGVERGSLNGYFNTEQGIFDRLQMIGIDDALNSVTEEEGEYGLTPVLGYFLNAVPRVFWPGKPSVNMANVFGHSVGLPETDDTTSISFSPVGEAYHDAKWAGVFFVAPAIWFLLFIIMDSLCGDTRKSPWGILALSLFAHEAPEGMLGGSVYLMTMGVIIISTIAFFSAYLLPLLASVTTGAKTRRAKQTLTAMPVAGRRGSFATRPPGGGGSL